MMIQQHAARRYTKKSPLGADIRSHLLLFRYDTRHPNIENA